MKTPAIVYTSEHYECPCRTLENNALHKLCEMLKLQNMYVISNAKCQFVDTVNTHLFEKDDDILEKVKYIFALYTYLPQSKTCDTLTEEPNFELLPYIPKEGHKLIYIDYFERSWNNQSQGQPWLLREEPFVHKWFLENADVYFKRELYSDIAELGILPYPEPTFHPGPVLKSYKLYDVFCSFPQKNTGLRLQAIQVCQQLRSEGYTVVLKDDCTPEQYYRFVSDSYITLDAYGAGQVNHRFLEIIALRSVCCRQRYTVQFYQDYDPTMILEYDSAEELYMTLKENIPNKELLDMMEERAYQHYQKYHTKMAVSRYLFENL